MNKERRIAAREDVFARLDEPKQPIPSRIPPWLRLMLCAVLLALILAITFLPHIIPSQRVPEPPLGVLHRAGGGAERRRL